MQTREPQVVKYSVNFQSGIMCGSRKFCQRLRGVLKTFVVTNAFYRGPYGPLSKSNWTEGVQKLLEVGPYQYIKGNL